MILTLDVGNSHIFGGLFDKDKLRFKFRKQSRTNTTSDELGIFLKSVLRENNIEAHEIRDIAICSVVPDLLYSLRNCAIKYFKLEPFVLGPGSRTGLNIKYKNPSEVGADRISNAIATTHLFPKKNLIIIDFGTANTLCAVSKEKEYLGGLILPGLKISVEALSSRTSKLPTVEIVVPEEKIGRTTTQSIQSGLFYGNLFQLRELAKMIKEEYFSDEESMIIGTGGFARLFENKNLFDEMIPDLVLIGLSFALKLNREACNLHK